MKVKHERTSGIKTICPDLKPKINRQREVAKDVPIVEISEDTLNLFCQVPFLEMFKEIKDLSSSNESLWFFIRSEKEDITELNENMLKSGNQDNLIYLWIAF